MVTDYASPRRTGRTPQAPTRRSGAWKLAYADFLTALCAFFLIMWLVHGLSSDGKNNLAEQFGAAHATSMTQDNAETGLSVAGQARDLLSASALVESGGGNVLLQAGTSDLRIELTDRAGLPLFERGNAQLNSRGDTLMKLAAQAIITLGIPVSIEGHTDSRPIERADYSNWELSSDRANIARRSLISNGVPAELVQSVAGLADTRPIAPDAPYLPQNRRLSIVFHLE
ncbi:OmpA/MotB family protein [Henriciella aquimarina]|uniref:OmpA/MotB family protein n=1 Tax=Henriciella aquimarina TaxID=545261 RepID=UPI000A04A881|nr:flagellar motor protein MotB [Henriciella aquimarina]